MKQSEIASKGQSVSCMPILFFHLQITKSDIRPHEKWAVSQVIADGHFNLLRGLCGYVWVNIITISPVKVERELNTVLTSSKSIGKLPLLVITTKFLFIQLQNLVFCLLNKNLS